MRALQVGKQIIFPMLWKWDPTFSLSTALQRTSRSWNFRIFHERFQRNTDSSATRKQHADFWFRKPFCWFWAFGIVQNQNHPNLRLLISSRINRFRKQGVDEHRGQISCNEGKNSEHEVSPCSWLITKCWQNVPGHIQIMRSWGFAILRRDLRSTLQQPSFTQTVLIQFTVSPLLCKIYYTV